MLSRTRPATVVFVRSMRAPWSISTKTARNRRSASRLLPRTVSVWTLRAPVAGSGGSAALTSQRPGERSRTWPATSNRPAHFGPMAFWTRGPA